MTETKKVETVTGTIHERGNGLPVVGDYVISDDDMVYEIVERVGGIHTGAPGEGNYYHARLRNTGMDSSDLTEEQYDDITCSVRIDQ